MLVLLLGIVLCLIAALVWHNANIPIREAQQRQRLAELEAQRARAQADAMVYEIAAIQHYMHSHYNNMDLGNDVPAEYIIIYKTIQQKLIRVVELHHHRG